MKENNYTHKRGNLTLTLAKSYGFCWGVERAVQMAYEARKQFPQEKMWITNEIIHNPSVNQVRTQRRRVARYGRKQCQP
jgi:4-hydroxy-3-methylbut-2-enyl diphosphate reductase